MIPECDHNAVFESVRRGRKLDVRINKVPGNIALNNYCFREGKITDVFLKGRRIEYVVVKLYPTGYDRYSLIKFPIQHVSLIYPIRNERREPYRVSEYVPQPEQDDKIVDTPVMNEDEQDSPAEDDYPDEVEYEDDDCRNDYE